VVIDEETSEASDGHNVSSVSYKDLEAILKYARKKGWLSE
jgi:hypothetical protein